MNRSSLGPLALMVTMVFALLACAEEELMPLPPHLEVELSGCAAMRGDGVCEVDARGGNIRVWVKAAAGASVSMVIQGKPYIDNAGGLDEGKLFQVNVPARARSIVVVAAQKRGTTTKVMRLSPYEVPAELVQAEALRNERGKLKEAGDVLLPLLNDPRPEVRARARGKLARIRGAAGDVDGAVGLYRDAIAQEQAEGMISDELDDRCALSFALLFNKRDPEGARRVLDEPRSRESAFPDGQARLPYYRAQIAIETGDLRRALVDLHRSASHAQRLGMEPLRLNALESEGTTLSSLGRFADAAKLVREVDNALPPETEGCRRAAGYTNLAWIALMAVEAGAPLPELNVEMVLDEALTLYQTTCDRPAELCNAFTNLALRAFQQHRPEEIRRFLDLAKQAENKPDLLVRAWWSIIEGGTLLREGRLEEALAVHERLVDTGRVAMLPDAELRGLVGRARTLDALGRYSEAKSAYQEVEDLLDRQTLWVPLGKGLGTFLTQYSTTRWHVDFLLREGSNPLNGARRKDESSTTVRAAAEAARRNHGRLLRALTHFDRIESMLPADRALWDKAVLQYKDGREDLTQLADAEWDLPKNELAVKAKVRRQKQERLDTDMEAALSQLHQSRNVDAPLWTPGAGELLLVYHPSADGWIAMALDQASAVAKRIGRVNLDAPKEELAKQLLHPFRDFIERAQEVRISASGALGQIDFHALPFEGDAPLIGRVPVLYVADVPIAAARRGPRITAMVLGDSRRDLQAAQREAEEVRDALTQKGWAVTLLAGNNGRYETVYDALKVEDFFHYAGHAQQGGLDGWESRLLLANEGTLGVADLLTLPKVPPYVVLSACETSAEGEHLGVAQAFVAAGAHAVVASPRPVDDRLTRRLIATFYRTMELSAEGSPDLASALRHAQIAAYRENARADWAAFRVVSP